MPKITIATAETALPALIVRFFQSKHSFKTDFHYILAYQRPFEVVVNFDGADSATNRLQGFKLTFTQTTDDCV